MTLDEKNDSCREAEGGIGPPAASSEAGDAGFRTTPPGSLEPARSQFFETNEASMTGGARPADAPERGEPIS